MKPLRTGVGAAIATACVALTAAGCTTSRGGDIFVDHLHLDTSQVPSGHEDATVEILQEPPERPFARVALLEAFAAFYAGNQVTWERLRQEISRKAIEVGGDGSSISSPGADSFTQLATLPGLAGSHFRSAGDLRGDARTTPWSDFRANL